jgi:hypothetical protein
MPNALGNSSSGVGFSETSCHSDGLLPSDVQKAVSSRVSRAEGRTEVFAFHSKTFLAVLDDNCGFIINAFFFANLLEVLVPL